MVVHGYAGSGCGDLWWWLVVVERRCSVAKVGGRESPKVGVWVVQRLWWVGG